jgi:electron transfer flavoprotein alpha subunit
MANGILIVAVPQRGKLTPAVYELVSAGKKLAEQLSQPLYAVVASDKAAALAGELAGLGVSKVFAVEHPSLGAPIDELQAKAAASVAAKEGVSRVLVPASVLGKAVAARLAVLLKAGLAADVTDLLDGGMMRRGYYSGNLTAEVEFKTPVGVLTMAPMSFPRAEPGAKGEVVSVSFDPGASKATFASFTAEESNEIDLGAAERVVSGGRGLGGPEGFKHVRDLAHAIGAAVGASRAAVDAGWIPYRHQVGLTGRAVRPKLYVAVGISGQIQHLAGMSSSQTIIAINTDASCPLMQLANVSVQGDYNELLPAITAEVKNRKGHPVAA